MNVRAFHTMMHFHVNEFIREEKWRRSEFSPLPIDPKMDGSFSFFNGVDISSLSFPSPSVLSCSAEKRQ